MRDYLAVSIVPTAKLEACINIDNIDRFFCEVVRVKTNTKIVVPVVVLPIIIRNIMVFEASSQ